MLQRANWDGQTDMSTIHSRIDGEFANSMVLTETPYFALSTDRRGNRPATAIDTAIDSGRTSKSGTKVERT